MRAPAGGSSLFSCWCKREETGISVLETPAFRPADKFARMNSSGETCLFYLFLSSIFCDCMAPEVPCSLSLNDKLIFDSLLRDSSCVLISFWRSRALSILLASYSISSSDLFAKMCLMSDSSWLNLFVSFDYLSSFTRFLKLTIS